MSKEGLKAIKRHSIWGLPNSPPRQVGTAEGRPSEDRVYADLSIAAQVAYLCSDLVLSVNSTVGKESHFTKHLNGLREAGVQNVDGAVAEVSILAPHEQLR